MAEEEGLWGRTSDLNGRKLNSYRSGHSVELKLKNVLAVLHRC